MKISIAWIFDHLGVDWHTYDIHDLIKQLSAKTAEIDGFKHHTWDSASFFLVEVTANDTTLVQVRCPERKKNLSLPPRPDTTTPTLHSLFLITQETNGTYRWTTLADLGGEREGLLPAVSIPPEKQASEWRKEFEAEDWIIEIENKSLTNRPDLWGHRGFAREIAALIGLTLLPEERLATPRSIRHYEKKSSTIDLSQPSACTRFAGLKLSAITCTPSLLPIAHRLIRVGAKPLNAWVDLTNYVMFDWGQPLHAFDAEHITGNLIVRQARADETIALLDGETATLCEQDCIVADEKKALSLAGIMGGRESAISPQTTSLFLEGAHFDAATIRRSASRLKKRTESSARFEKSLDPNQNTVALERYLTLAHELGLPFNAEDSITSVGPLAQEITIDLSHKTLVDKLGTTITEGQVRSILIHLGFGIQIIDGNSGLSYRVTVPTFRGTKDIRIPEDLIEEVARFYGYDSIPPIIPSRIMRPYSTDSVLRKRMIKRHCAFALSMRELETYPLYDEPFLKKLGLTINDAPEVLNPLSENSRRLVTSLIPNLLHAIEVNSVAEKRLRFFELNRIWKTLEPTQKFLDIPVSDPRILETQISEKHICSGIFYDRNSFNFYEGKAALESLFVALDIFVIWKKAIDIPFWADKNRIAELWLTGFNPGTGAHPDGLKLGYAGMVSAQLMATVAEGESFAFELDSALLINALRAEKKFESPSRFQAVSLDISMLTPNTILVATLEEAIAFADARIRDVTLIDIFEKEEWGNRRSIAIRYIVQDDEKTLSKEDLDAVQSAVQSAVSTYGVEIR